MPDGTRPSVADAGYQAHLEWSRLSDEEVLVRRDEFVRACRDHGGKVAEWPPSLHQALDLGLGLEAAGDWVERLAELVYFILPSTPPLERLEEAVRARARAQGTIPPPKALRGGRRRRERQERAIYWQWAADLYEMPELAERVKEALPSEMVADFEAIADLHRRPYRLNVRTLPSWWRCHNCGAAFDEGEEEALVVLADASNDLSEDITYCRGCISSLISPGASDRRGRC
ncbi:MAG TPA: hypothetical protein VK988_20605 [Acidimicrobiales bacterium]|nr:hypothetical protein [Acidimicrobiales bacterium]